MCPVCRNHFLLKPYKTAISLRTCIGGEICGGSGRISVKIAVLLFELAAFVRVIKILAIGELIKSIGAAWLLVRRCRPGETVAVGRSRVSWRLGCDAYALQGM